HPGLFDVRAAYVLAQIDEDRRLAWRRVAVGEIERTQFLELALDAVCDLIEHLVHGRTRPVGLDDHGLDRERRILFTAELRVDAAASDQGRQHQVPDERAMPERPLRQIETGHEPASGMITDWPAAKLCTPAMTTRSPAATPLATAIVLPSRLATL